MRGPRSRELRVTIIRQFFYFIMTLAIRNRANLLLAEVIYARSSERYYGSQCFQLLEDSRTHRRIGDCPVGRMRLFGAPFQCSFGNAGRKRNRKLCRVDIGEQRKRRTSECNRRRADGSTGKHITVTVRRPASSVHDELVHPSQLHERNILLGPGFGSANVTLRSTVRLLVARPRPFCRSRRDGSAG